ncbi:hypothetical protein CHARACLAT_025058 [Characodon lateralis]|uniref:Uncharacterized protein n=1 Tax=Characodon lateralis TaxID=208331 RepID=A0ABU7EGQ3_9TELE|nr:hypothetical protein [Characodon lateralis]
MDFAEIEENINALGEKARKNELAVEDMDREHSALTTAACLAPRSAHPSLTTPPHTHTVGCSCRAWHLRQNYGHQWKD